MSPAPIPVSFYRYGRTHRISATGAEFNALLEAQRKAHYEGHTYIEDELEFIGLPLTAVSRGLHYLRWDAEAKQELYECGFIFDPPGLQEKGAHERMKAKWKKMGGIIYKHGMLWIWFLPFSKIPGFVDDPESDI